MKRALLTFALCAGVAVPAAAMAQSAAPAPPAARAPMMRPTPSPEMRALFDKIQGQARSAAYAALTPAHAASVASIAGQVAAKTLDMRTAMKQIDALITVSEEHAVLAAAANSRREMFAAMAQAGGRPGPMMGGGPPMGGPGGPPHVGGGPGGDSHGWQHGHGHGHRGGRGFGHGPSASGYLLMVAMTPEQMHALMPPRARTSPAP